VLKVTNVSDKEFRYFDAAWQKRRPWNYGIEVMDSLGKSVPMISPPMVISAIMAQLKIAPKETVTFEGFVNRSCSLDKPGEYTAYAHWNNAAPVGSPQQPPIESNGVAFRVEETTAASRDARLSAALKQFEEAQGRDQRLDALDILGFTLDPRAIPTVVKASRESDLAYEPEYVLFGFPDREAVRSGLVEELRSYGPYEKLDYMLSHLKVPGETTVPLLAKWVREGDTEQRSSALHALFMVGDYVDQSLKVDIVEALQDKDRMVRDHAILALGAGRYGDVLEELMPLAESDPDRTVRGQATTALGWQKDDRAVPLLEKLTADPTKELSYAAVNALETIGSPTAKAALERCAQSSDAKMQEQCRQALENLSRRAGDK